MLIELGRGPTVDDVIKVMAEHFPYLVETAEGRSTPNLLPDPEIPNAWCEANVGLSARKMHRLSLSIDTTKFWCHTWGTYGFKSRDDAFLFKLVFG
jgi:hypothetical protein